MNLQQQCFEECEVAGWDPDRKISFAEEIAHLHSEISEAFEWYRKHKDFGVHYREDGKPEGVFVEFADALIGMFYLAELHGQDLLEALEIKHQWNLKRSYEAEGRKLHK
jgi:NTP pyrophosphatase (non-canonical NTP hydrolase)